VTLMKDIRTALEAGAFAEFASAFRGDRARASDAAIARGV